MGTREKKVIRAGILNVIVNLILATLKIIVGKITASIAITLDGIDSLSDGFSSALTIIGTKIAQRPANREHPFGFGRIEYLTSCIVAALIIAAGGSSLNSSIQAIRSGTVSTYTTLSLVLVALAAVTKGALGLYTRALGRKLGSDPLIANGTDSFMGSFVSGSTLLAALLNIAFGIGIESWLAGGISILIIKSGFDILMDTVSKLLGQRQDPINAECVEKAALSVDGVRFVNGVILLDFGPTTVRGTLHVTVDANMTVAEFSDLSYRVCNRVEEECGIRLVSIGVYPSISEMTAGDQRRQAEVAAALWKHEDVLEVRGLFVDSEHKTCHFDAVADFSVKDFKAFEEELRATCEKVLPGYHIMPHVLSDVGD